ncbi:MAG: hypothetical protein C4529_07080 [Deltaproteobacteria bacterium]|nr:MAG: hypothetical protein C4529_07080 [Deltaproteobacteria bacterium]
MSLIVLDGSGVAQTLKSTLDTGEHVPHHKVDSVAGNVSAIQSGAWNVGVTGTLPAITPGTGATNLGKAEDAAHTTGDVGVMVFGVRNDNVAATLTGTDGDYTPIAVDSKGRVFSTTGGNATAGLSNVASSASSVTILAANAARKGAIVYNDVDKYLYLKFGATASTTSFTVKMGPGDYYEVPFGYTGILDGIWEASPTGSARVTEIT